MKKLLALTLAGALLATALVTGPALGAGVKKFDTTVTINFSQSTYSAKFFGKVKSDKNACKKDRKVLVFHKTNSGKVKVGSDKSNDRGRWRLNVGGTPPPGDYFAKAKKKLLNGGDVVCKSDKSPTISVP